MGVIFGTGYALPVDDEPLTHARILHAGNWLTGTASASSTATGHFVDAPNNSLTYEKWQPTSSSGQLWDQVFSPAVTADCCCIAAHNLGDSGSTIKIQYYDGVSYVDLTAATAITDNMPIFIIFEEATTLGLRLLITAGTSAPTLGVIKYGKSLQMPRPLYGGHAPLDLSRETTIRSSISETGEFLGRTKLREQFSTSIKWQHITADWMRANWKPLQQAVESEPFFIAWRPETFSEVGYCQTDKSPTPSNMGIRDLMSVSMSIRGYGYE